MDYINKMFISYRCSYKYDALGSLYRKVCSDGTNYAYLVDPFGPYGSDIIAEVCVHAMFTIGHDQYDLPIILCTDLLTELLHCFNRFLVTLLHILSTPWNTAYWLALQRIDSGTINLMVTGKCDGCLGTTLHFFICHLYSVVNLVMHTNFTQMVRPRGHMKDAVKCVCITTRHEDALYPILFNPLPFAIKHIHMHKLL